ncbi:isocitrate dehydrogenase [NAD] subunit beta, mitochondrial isoform X1 [Hydra vulgaris]|uniref:isocitrate dehydrogenase [NAD] subunit beta, mitochondrial isoform X1 n=1 Tax=Hydra vulgaris TaxID=6087 RepID=UPI00064183D2|nr:isocitrate dehydrogenase [NAD] subunit beta, mitochondrial [Hydra vulgaris]
MSVIPFIRRKVLNQLTSLNVCKLVTAWISNASSAGSISSFDDPIEGAERKTVTLIPGDGVGPEITAAVKHVFSSIGVPVDWDIVYASDIGTYGEETALKTVIDSMKRTRVGLKGILATPTSIGAERHLSLNQQLKLKLDLFANIVHCKSMPGLPTRHKNVDIVVIREQTEGEYTSLEHESVSGVIEMIKVITRTKSERIAKFAFDYAMKHKRKKVVCVHKANIMKLGDGLFFESCKRISKMYPKIEFEGMIIDNTCMQLVSKPQQFDVMVMPNLYGSIVNNVGTALVGGAGVVCGKSFGREFAMFEPGARHTYAQRAGLNVANPTAMLFAACDMLEHIHFRKHSRMIRDAVIKTISERKYLTMDMGGSCSTAVFTNRIIQNVKLDV